VPKSDDGSTDGTIFEEWGKVSLEAGDAFGKSLRVVDESAQNMREAGFVDVTERRFRVPIGTWAKDPRLKELGRYNRLQWSEGIEGWAMMLLTSILKVLNPSSSSQSSSLILVSAKVGAGRSRSIPLANEARTSRSKDPRLPRIVCITLAPFFQK
jgi:hypothetical protein